METRRLSFLHSDGAQVLRDVTLSVQHGERLALLGSNGAGKTTLALHFNGVYTPTSGDVLVEDELLTRETLRRVRQRVGIVMQDPDDQLFSPSLAEDVAFGPSNYGVGGDELQQRVRDTLESVGLSERRDAAPHQLSEGQKRRAAIACVLAMRPSVLILDEPTAHLDGRSRAQLSQVLGSLDAHGVNTLLLVTHDLAYAERHCERAIVLNEGGIVADAPLESVLSDAALLRVCGLTEE